MSAQPRVFDYDAVPVNVTIPRDILRIRGVRAEPRFAYGVLWAFNGGKAGRVQIDFLAFREVLDASERAVRRWLAALEKVGLLEILHREPRFAEVYLRDWRRRGDRRGRSRKTAAASQLTLPFAEVGGEEPEASIPIWAHRPATTARRPDPFEPPTAG